MSHIVCRKIHINCKYVLQFKQNHDNIITLFRKKLPKRLLRCHGEDEEQLMTKLIELLEDEDITA